jgi:hypothetical protein
MNAKREIAKMRIRAVAVGSGTAWDSTAATTAPRKSRTAAWPVNRLRQPTRDSVFGGFDTPISSPADVPSVG